MARTMTDEEAMQYAPVVREFITAVNDRDELVVEAALHHTDPRVLAVLAAGWCGELENRVLEMKEAGLRLAESEARLSAGYTRARRRVDELQEIQAKQANMIAELREKVRELEKGAA